MIRVNLLPEEYRKVESTSLSLFLLFLIGVIVVALAFVVWVTLQFQGGALSEELESHRARLARITAEASVVEKLEAELAQYDMRLTTVMAIRAGRIYWSKKLDRLVADTPGNIWFVSVRMRQAESIRVAPGAAGPPGADGGFLELNCFQKTNDYKILARYRDTLMEDRIFYADFNKIRPPEFVTARWPSAVEEDQVTLKFTVVLYLKPQIIFTP
jgi:Tfp pilus assembly protein PilN